jgi:hypothetical protein
MAAFEWLELQTLTGDIATARSRLTAARSNKDDRRVRLLEQEIASAEGRRARLLAFLTDHVAGAVHETADADAAGKAPTATDDELFASDGAVIAGDDAVIAGDDAPIAGDDAPIAGDGDRQSVVVELRSYAADSSTKEGRVAAAPRHVGDVLNQKGEITVWEQLTPSDLDRARSELDARRDEMLARHAEELKSLETDREQLASLETAIAQFLRRFSPAESEVIKLGEERELRAAG